MITHHRTVFFCLLAIEKAPRGSAEEVQRKCRGREREREREEEKKKNIIDARLLARQQAGRNAGRCSDRQLGKQARLNHSTPEAGK